MDKELIDEFNLDNVVQEEYGLIDNQTGMKTIITGELFSSFITGQTHKKHGHVGITRPIEGDEWKQKILDYASPEWFRQNIRGFQRLYNTLGTFLDFEQRYFLEKDFDIETIFDKIEHSKPIFVPCYNPSLALLGDAGTGLLNKGFGYDKKLEMNDRFDLNPRKNELFEELRKMKEKPEIFEPYDFMMVHFHSPDQIQHKYGDMSFNETYNENKLKRRYDELDNFAGSIKQEAKDAGFDIIVFMSDHGRPFPNGHHNKYAFYSSNKELFPEETPKITDFFDKFVELSGDLP